MKKVNIGGVEWYDLGGFTVNELRCKVLLLDNKYNNKFGKTLPF